MLQYQYLSRFIYTYNIVTAQIINIICTPPEIALDLPNRAIIRLRAASVRNPNLLIENMYIISHSRIGCFQ